MRKFIILITTVIIVLFNNIALAVEIDQTVVTGGTTVSLNFDSDSADTKSDIYTVVIPSVIQISPDSGVGYCDIVLKSGWQLNTAIELSVRLVNAQNGIKNNAYGFTLKNNAGDEIPYEIYHGDSSISGTSDSYFYYKTYELLKVTRYQSNTIDRETGLRCVCNTECLPGTGVYTDVLTFGVFTE